MLIGILSIILFSQVSIVPYLHDVNFSETVNSKTIEMIHDLADESWDFEDVSLSVYNAEGALQGYNLFSVSRFNSLTLNYSRLLVVVDMDGNTIAQHDAGTTGRNDLPASLIDQETALVGIDTGAALWHLNNNSITPLPFTSHHEYEFNPNSNTVFTFEWYFIEINGTNYRYDWIKEYDLSGVLVWSLDTRTFIPPEWMCLRCGELPTYVDLPHSNTIFYDAETDTLLYNPRNIDTFFKINHTNSEIIWGIGEHGNFSMYSLAGDPVSALFSHSHSVEQVNDTTYILFDNDYHDDFFLSEEKSRIVEITVNETTMTANHSWIWTAPDSYYCRFWGDADRLPNGNRLGTFGYFTHNEGGYSARLVEVDESGTIVWSMDFPDSGAYSYGIYRCERVLTSPYVSKPEDITTNPGQEVTIQWDVGAPWRSRGTTNGNYTILFNDEVEDEGTILFDPFWQTQPVGIATSDLGPGLTNATISVMDEWGNVTSDTIMVTVRDIVLLRDCPSSIELGQTNADAVWTVMTLFEDLNFTIQVNGSLYLESELVGGEISLHLDEFDPGFHIFNVTVSGSFASESDEVGVHIYANEIPLILGQSADSILTFGDYILLNWTIDDRSPKCWDLYIDDTLETSTEWLTTPYQISWNFSSRIPGLHDITLQLFDYAGNNHTTSVFVDIVSPGHPIVIWACESTEIPWNQSEACLEWEVFFASSFTLWKNGTSLLSGPVEDYSVEVVIDWHSIEWRSGYHNLTLAVTDDSRVKSSLEVWFTIFLDLGDPFADLVVEDESEWYINGDAALSENDGVNATIYEDYASGYLTLDMGEGEEIIDGDSEDFRVYATGGPYGVYVSESLEQGFILLASSQGTDSFDISTLGLTEVRYVRIMCQTSEPVYIDAVRSLHFTQLVVEHQPPTIVGLGSIVMYEDNASVIIYWEVYDVAPWEYTILVDDVVVESGTWANGMLEFQFTNPGIGNYSVKLILTDLFFNQALDTVEVIVVSRALLNEGTVVVLLILSVGVAIPIILIVIKKFEISRMKGWGWPWSRE